MSFYVDGVLCVHIDLPLARNRSGGPWSEEYAVVFGVHCPGCGRSVKCLDVFVAGCVAKDAVVCDGPGQLNTKFAH